MREFLSPAPRRNDAQRTHQITALRNLRTKKARVKDERKEGRMEGADGWMNERRKVGLTNGRT